MKSYGEQLALVKTEFEQYPDPKVRETMMMDRIAMLNIELEKLSLTCPFFK